MIQVHKPSSECGDCRLCRRGIEAAPGANGHAPGPTGHALDVEAIVREVLGRIQGPVPAPSRALEVPVGVSARHCHLNDEGLEVLFGPGYKLKVYRELFQPGAFAAEEWVSVVGPRLRALERVRILGPTRGYNQVELARTDAIFLGVDPPVRDSGDLTGAAPVTFVGPKGSITAPAAIRAARHIHLSPADVAAAGLDGKSRVNVRVGGEKGLLFHNVRLKIDPAYVPEIHLDTDDANAAELVCGDRVAIEP